ncbi:hypothetical protein [Pseudoduganella albidiflava]|uniref:Uncharacterized protein n=1 Tax=Pseudoduganella albidiflava TaxID=321983 RepID=A0ABX5RLV3_9BURK|nr:hypothetical protein [Pseudoduganella albidiflava]QBH99548.1 hypothetical protein EYF70_00845 [Pseudoduganella albidiflava]
MKLFRHSRPPTPAMKKLLLAAALLFLLAGFLNLWTGASNWLVFANFVMAFVFLMRSMEKGKNGA